MQCLCTLSSLLLFIPESLREAPFDTIRSRHCQSLAPYTFMIHQDDKVATWGIIEELPALCHTALPAHLHPHPFKPGNSKSFCSHSRFLHIHTLQFLQPAPFLLLPIPTSVSQHPSLAHTHLLPPMPLQPARPTPRSSSSSLAHFHAVEALLSKPVWRMFVYALIVIFLCKLGPMHFGIFISSSPSFSLSPSPSFPPVILCKIVWMMIAGEVMVTMMNQAGGWRAQTYLHRTQSPMTS